MHRSVAPQSEREHLKIAFFFRASAKGERRAKRGLAAEGADGDEDVLAQRRRHVVHELSAYNFSAQSLAEENKR